MGVGGGQDKCRTPCHSYPGGGGGGGCGFTVILRGGNCLYTTRALYLLQLYMTAVTAV